MNNFSRLLEVIDALPDTLRPKDEAPLSNLIPGAWPTLGELRAYVKHHQDLVEAIDRCRRAWTFYVNSPRAPIAATASMDGAILNAIALIEHESPSISFEEVSDRITASATKGPLKL